MVTGAVVVENGLGCFGGEMSNSVVIHVDDPAQAPVALRNVANLLDDLGDKGVQVEVVVNGLGLSVLTKGSPVTDSVESLRGRGVALLACRNSMEAAGIAPEDLLEGIQVIPAGITHLVQRQHQGWAYVRP
jgi:intracellular sulfur oxidation DsrE/DsrF family protein